MTYQSANEALPVLIDLVGPPTSEQIAIAEVAGIEVPPELPRLVVAARLRNGLSDVLATATPTAPRDYQLDILEELAPDAGVVVSEIHTRSEADAWILYCRLQLRIQAHKMLSLERGDIVRRAGADDDAIYEMSSIDGEGRVWLRGRGGRLWPDQLEIVAKAKDSDDAAVQARQIATNRRSASMIEMLNEARRRELARFCPAETVTVEDLSGLHDVIDNAKDERPIQAYLDEHPQLLVSVLRGPHHYVRSKVRLGDKYETDYMLADAGSDGIHWIYVELETPCSPVLLKNGTALHDRARIGVNQIKNWREWISNNLAYARQLCAENGLGLPGIRPGDDGLVLVGRRQSLRNDHANVRRQLYEDTRIAVRTYDWLLTIIKWSMTKAGPPPGTSHVLQLYMDD